MRRTKDGLIPTIKITVLLEQPDPDGIEAYGRAAPERITLTSESGIRLGSGVIVDFEPEDA